MRVPYISVFTLFVASTLALSACDTTQITESNPSQRESKLIFSPAEVETSTPGDGVAKRISAKPIRVAEGDLSVGKAATDQVLKEVAVAKLAESDFEAGEAGVVNVNFATVPSSNTKTHTSEEDGDFNGVVATLVTPGAEYHGGVFYVELENNSFGDGSGLVSECFEFGASDFLSDDFYVTGAFNVDALWEGGACESSEVNPEALRGPGAVARVKTDGSLVDTASSTSKMGVQLEKRGGLIFTAFGTTPQGGGFENEYQGNLDPELLRPAASPVLGQDAYQINDLRVATLRANGQLSDYVSGSPAPDVSFDTGLSLNNLERADIDHYRKAGTDFYAVAGQEGNGRVYAADGTQLYSTDTGYIVSTDISENWIAFAGEGLVYLMEFKDDGSFGTLYELGGDEDFPHYASSIRVVGDTFIVGTDEGVHLLQLQKP